MSEGSGEIEKRGEKVRKEGTGERHKKKGQVTAGEGVRREKRGERESAVSE